jgi:hypothetical protein
MEYLQSGKYTKSLSQLITDSPSVTEMKLQKIEPWPLGEFEKQFDLQHLPQKTQKHALKGFKKRIKIFCRHEIVPMTSKWTLRLKAQNPAFKNSKITHSR